MNVSKGSRQNGPVTLEKGLAPKVKYRDKVFEVHRVPSGPKLDLARGLAMKFRGEKVHGRGLKRRYPTGFASTVQQVTNLELVRAKGIRQFN